MTQAFLRTTKGAMLSVAVLLALGFMNAPASAQSDLDYTLRLTDTQTGAASTTPGRTPKSLATKKGPSAQIQELNTISENINRSGVVYNKQAPSAKRKGLATKKNPVSAQQPKIKAPRTTRKATGTGDRPFFVDETGIIQAK